MTTGDPSARVSELDFDLVTLNPQPLPPSVRINLVALNPQHCRPTRRSTSWPSTRSHSRRPFAST